MNTRSTFSRPTPISLPNLLRGQAFAQAPEALDLATLSRQFGSYHAEVKAQATTIADQAATIENLKKDIDRLTLRQATASVYGSRTGTEPGPVYRALGDFMRLKSAAKIEFGDYLVGRMQDPSFQAAMSVGSDPDGGYTVIDTVETGIRNIAQNVSPFRSLASVVTIGGGSYDILINPNLSAANWVGEQTARPATTGPTIDKVSIDTGILYAMPQATESLLQDSRIDLAQWLVNNVGIAFAQKEGLAFVSGDGVGGKPRGILSVPMETGDDFARSTFFSVQYIGAGSSSPSNVQIADALIATSQKLRAPYRQNAVWLMNRSFSTVVRQLKDGQNLYLWNEDYGRIAAGQPAMLCGFPVYFEENMPSAGANATPAVLVDLKQAYQIVDRPGIGVLRDPYTARPYVGFYTTKRVGGSLVDYNACKVLKYT